MRSGSATVPGALRTVVERANRPGFFFVNIGANDGVTNDYIFPFLGEYDWRGLAVEPLETSFTQLAQNYARFPQVILERAAIADSPRRLHYLTTLTGYDRPWINQVGTLDRNVLETTIETMRLWEMDGPVPGDLEKSIASVAVPCISFNALMAKHGVEAIDFLSIDAEGSDYEIFRSIDFNRYRPRILLIETSHIAPDERRDFDRKLAHLDYVFLTQLDIITEAFVLRELMPRNALRRAIMAIRRRVGAAGG